MRIKCINEVMQWHYSSSITTHEQKKEIVGSIWKFLRSGLPFLSLAKFVLSFKNSIWIFWSYILTKRGKSSAEAFQMCLKFYIYISPLLNIWSKFNIFHQFTFLIYDLQSEYREAHANWKPTVLPNCWSPWWYEPRIAFSIT